MIEVKVYPYVNLYKCNRPDSDIVITFEPDTHNPDFGGKVHYLGLTRRYHWLIDDRIVFEWFPSASISKDVQAEYCQAFRKYCIKNELPGTQVYMRKNGKFLA